ncbi:MAG: MFS transporter [Clostridiales bacterium]|jgi:Na+/melibiose symporter-like transporter|nr:MFS transporter [Clostridiales bacterium]
MKLNYKQTIFVGLAFFSIQIFWQFYYAYMPLTLSLIFGLDDLQRGAVMSIDNFIALFMLPLFGMLSDKTKNKYGKRKPYILIGTLLSVLFFIGMGTFEHMQLNALVQNGHLTNIVGLDSEQIRLTAYEFMKTNPAIFVGFIIFVVLTLFSMGIHRTPAVALMPDVTSKPLRSQGNAIINLMGGAGGVIATVIFTFLVKDYETKMTAYIITAAVMVVAIILFFILVDEPALVAKREKIDRENGIDDGITAAKVRLAKPVQKSLLFLLASIALWFIGYYSIYSSFTIYANQNLGMADGKAGIFFIIAMFVSAVAFIPIAYFSSTAGRKKTIMGGIILLAVSLGAGVFVTKNNIWLMYILFPLVGVGWASINVNSFPMVAEMSTGSNVGKFTGYYYAASMAAQGLAPIFSGFFMKAIDRTVLFPLGAVCVALSFVTMLFVKHGDSKMPPKKSGEPLTTDETSNADEVPNVGEPLKADETLNAEV